MAKRARTTSIDPKIEDLNKRDAAKIRRLEKAASAEDVGRLIDRSLARRRPNPSKPCPDAVPERPLPCPNLECRSEKVETYRFMQTAASNQQYVRCLGCGMTGPRGDGPAEAVRLWNHSLPRGGGPDDLM